MVFLSCPCRRLAGEGVGFHSRRRRYGTEAGERDCIIVLSPAWNPHPVKCSDGNSAKKRFAGRGFNPRTAAETEVENPLADTRCGGRRVEGVPQFAATDRYAH